MAVIIAHLNNLVHYNYPHLSDTSLPIACWFFKLLSFLFHRFTINKNPWKKIPSKVREILAILTDISTQGNNTNNEIPAGSASLQIQAIANTLVPKILQGVNERLLDLVTNILSRKGFVSTAGYADKSDEEESDGDIGSQDNQIIRDAGTQITSNRDAGAQQASNRDTGA